MIVLIGVIGSYEPLTATLVREADLVAESDPLMCAFGSSEERSKAHTKRRPSCVIMKADRVWGLGLRKIVGEGERDVLRDIQDGDWLVT